MPLRSRCDKQWGIGPKIVFTFPGQGSQYLGMGCQLYSQEPVFRQAIDECGCAIGRRVGWSLLEQLFADESDSRLREIAVAQPAIFAVQVALAALWRSWGVEPDAIVGYSLGEIAAAHVAGALTLDDAARIVCCRSQLMKRNSGLGAMAVVGLGYDETEQALRACADRVSIAASNGPSITVISGNPAAVEGLLSALQRRDIYCHLVNADVASHSPQMDPLCEELEQALTEIRPQSASIPFFSSVTLDFGRDLRLDGGYWAQHLRQPVKFAAATERLLNEGFNLFIEISPHPTLATAIRQTSERLKREAEVIASLRRGEDGRMMILQSLDELYAQVEGR